LNESDQVLSKCGTNQIKRRIVERNGQYARVDLQMFSTVRSNGAAQWVRSTQFLVRSPLKGQNGAADRQLGANGGPLSIALAESGHNA
jgi:hypothetical protein